MKNCNFCNKLLIGKQKAFCSKLCNNRYQSIHNNGFKGKHHSKKTKLLIRKVHLGKTSRNKNTKVSDGHSYTFIFRPNAHGKNKQGYVREHRYIIEKKLGRKLKKNEVIHHKDGNGTNNKLVNLFLCKSKKEHWQIHWRLLDYVILKLGPSFLKGYYKWFKSQSHANVNNKKRNYLKRSKPC
jgi:hypothetical protein